MSEKPMKPCGRHPRETFTIGLFPVEGQTWQQTYAKWARARNLNPWCGRPLDECPEPK